MDYLYPDKKYIDRVAANYMPQDDKVGQILMYHTQVYNVQRTKGLKNATNRKWEAGFDIKLSDKHKLSLIGYHDKPLTDSDRPQNILRIQPTIILRKKD